VLEAFGLDPDRRMGWLEVDLDVLLNHTPRRSLRISPVSRFPASDIDLAFVVPVSVSAGEVQSTLRGAAGDLLESVALYDVYRSDAQAAEVLGNEAEGDSAVVGVGGTAVERATRSLTYRLRFRAMDRTLTDEEVGALRARCIVAVEGIPGVHLRG
jgi:phenylalanyl-tRNA synthetase beta chain